ncbi:protein phosphatase 2c 16, partial [Quercus suber]
DRYLKPWIIPEPAVMFIPRSKEDECLILASDGLWDVMTNEEYVTWLGKEYFGGTKNGVTLPTERGEGIDPAAQAQQQNFSQAVLFKKEVRTT